MALLGLAAKRPGHVVSSAIEHPSVLAVCALLAARGVSVTQVGVDADGRVDVGSVAEAIRPDTSFVSIMHANNETGVMQPIGEIGAICRRAGIFFHSDAVQTAGRTAVTFADLCVDALSVSAHKLGGPKGVGALIVDKSLALQPLLYGGNQERGRRPGTENLSGIVGFGAAMEYSHHHWREEAAHMRTMRDLLENRLQHMVPGLTIFGQNADRLPNTTSVGIEGFDGETLVMNLDLAGVALSSGSACSSGKTSVSHVLQAMGVNESLGRSAVRISTGWNSRLEDIERFVDHFVKTVARLRRMLPSATGAG